MERISKLYDKVKDVEDCHRQMEDKMLAVARIQSEVERLTHELEVLENHRISEEIEAVEEEYEGCLREIDTLTFYSSECQNLDELRRMFSRVPEPEVLSAKSLSFLKTLLYPSYVSCDSVKDVLKPGNQFYRHGANEVVILKINKEIEELLRFLATYPGVSRESYDALKTSLSEELDGAIPAELLMYEDAESICLVFQSRSRKDVSGEVQLHGLRRVERAGVFSLTSHALSDVLRSNLRLGLMERGLSSEDIERNNEWFDGTDFYIADAREWRLDVIMKAIIDQTRKPKDMHVQKASSVEDNMPAGLSVDYLRLAGALDLLGTAESRRVEKARMVVKRAVVKMFGRHRYEASIHNHFVQFADLSHFLKTHPEYSSVEELARSKEDLFYRIVKESSRIRVSLREPVMVLKLYFKELHFDFMENVALFVPRVNQILFEAQMFELLIEEFSGELLGLKRLSGELRSNLGAVAEYILDLSFHLPSGAVMHKKKLAEIKILLESSINEVLDLYKGGRLQMSWEDLVALCTVVFEDPKDVGYLIKRAGK
jgi:hypothetical protein